MGEIGQLLVRRVTEHGKVTYVCRTLFWILRADIILLSSLCPQQKSGTPFSFCVNVVKWRVRAWIGEGESHRNPVQASQTSQESLLGLGPQGQQTIKCFSTFHLPLLPVLLGLLGDLIGRSNQGSKPPLVSWREPITNFTPNSVKKVSRPHSLINNPLPFRLLDPKSRHGLILMRVTSSS